LESRSKRWRSVPKWLFLLACCTVFFCFNFHRYLVKVFNCTVICIGSMPEDELKRQATIVRQIVEFLFGPAFETWDFKSILHHLFSQYPSPMIYID
jgi:hypothetical protein